MVADNTAIAGPKVRLSSIENLDGRTVAAKGARAFIEALENDLGGADRVSIAEREIIQRAALASAMLAAMEATFLKGQGVDVSAYTTLVNTQRRLLTTLGLQRRPRDVTPDLAKYLAANQPPLTPPPAYDRDDQDDDG